VNFVVAANAGPARSGTMTIAGQTATVTQASGCSFTLNPATGQTVAKTAGSYAVTIAASNSGCGWTARVDSASWLTITSSASGTGGSTVTFSVSSNTSKQRTGTLTIAQRTFTVTQLKGD
jgi:hypothetical protein